MIVRANWLLRAKARLAGLDPNEVLLTTIGSIIIRGDIDPADDEILHERLHGAQWIELLGIGYVIVFWCLYLVLLLRYRSRGAAYALHPMELEAYEGMRDPEYLKRRRSFAWIKHLRGT